MSKATITITERDGSLDMLTTYEGGFSEDSPAHVAAMLLGQRMNDLAEAQGPARHLTQDEVDALQAGGQKPALVLVEG